MTRSKLLKDKVFHIYHQGECIHNNLEEDTFNRLWEYYIEEEVEVHYDYEVCEIDRETIMKSSY